MKKFLYSFGETHERDRRTDGRTPHADVYRAYAYASRGKNGISDVCCFRGVILSQYNYS